VDARLALEPDAGVAPRVGGGAVKLDVEGDRLGDVADGEVTGQLVLGVGNLLDPRGDERDLRELVRREEVVAAQVTVTVRTAGVDARGLDRELRRGRCWVVPIDREGAGEVVELAT